MKKTLISLALTAAIVTFCFGQGQTTKNTVDQSLRSSGRVNSSTLGMEFDLPMGSYPGRGISLPLGLSYSSKVWRFEDDTTISQVHGPSRTYVYGIYSNTSAAGWSSSLAQPYIEYTGQGRLFDQYGRPGTGQGVSYIRRVTIFLPSGESHELRADDGPHAILSGGVIPSSAWEGTFYASDGSGIKYVQDTTSNTQNPVFRLYLPDGSYYDFKTGAWEDSSVAFNPCPMRRALRLTDVNGNYVQFNDPNTQTGIHDPYGSWTDQLGRTFPIMIPPNTPNFPATTSTMEDSFTLPGMSSSAPYVLTWKRLANVFAKTTYQLKYIGGASGTQGNVPYSPTLFNSGVNLPGDCGVSADLYVNAINFENVENSSLVSTFNPMVLADVKLPNGLYYHFSYNERGEIETIKHPTGGHEEFDYSPVASLAGAYTAYQQTNRGVIQSRTYENDNDANPLTSYYGASVSDYNYKTTVISPDGTQTDNFIIAAKGSMQLL